ncbi:hypothetical protein FACS1894166_00920 [Bacilli bacterium]|nr:hypothetical protein FACS1894166_00920 [Bacilli bacterium]
MEKIQFSKRAIISIVAIGLVGVTVGGSTVITSCSKPRLEMKEIDVRYSLSSTFNNRVSGQLSSSEYATMGFTTIDDKQPKGNGIINVDDTFFGYNKNFYIGF